MTLFIQVTKERAQRLLKHGFRKEPLKTVYELLRLRKGETVAILYLSGKLFLQGKNTEAAARLISRLNIGVKQATEQFKMETGWIIGSDESLKGDTFGGIVVAAVKANAQSRLELSELGVADSKLLSDKEILLISEKIKNTVSCEIINLLPDEYNERDGNVTALLNKLHRQAAHNLQPGKHIVDKYPGCTVGDIAVEKAESKYVEVAAASVLARAAALHQLGYLSLTAGFTLPKGSAHVALALHELQERRLDFKKFVKIDFKNVVEFLKKSKFT